MGFTESHILGEEEIDTIKIKINGELKDFKFFEGRIKG